MRLRQRGPQIDFNGVAADRRPAAFCRLFSVGYTPIPTPMSSILALSVVSLL